MAEPMTLEETIAEARELVEMTNGRFESAMLHWLTTLKAQLETARSEVRILMAPNKSYDAIKAERDRLAEQNRKLREALRPFVDPQAPARESELVGMFWRTVAVTKENHAAAVALLAETEPSDGG